MSNALERDNQAVTDENLLRVLSPSEELVYLLRGIEEASKHARTILFGLITISAFVMTAALSEPSGSGTSIKLPITGNEVSTNQLFFWSPLVVLAIFLYLQVYIQELIGRFNRLYEFQQRTHISPSIPRDLVFPWIFVIGLESRRQRREASPSIAPYSPADQFARTAPITTLPLPYLYPLAAVIIWFFGPLVLATLLFAFLREEKAVAIVPCLTFLVSSWVAIRFVRPNRSSLESSAWIVLGAALVMLTLSSVPELRETTYLSTLWELRYPLIQWAKKLVVPLAIAMLTVALPVAVLVLIGRRVYTWLRPIRAYRQRIESALNSELDSGRALRESYVTLRGVLRSNPGVQIEGRALVDRARRALILGPPGSGKTTLLRYLGLTIAMERDIDGSLVPIFLRLNRVGSSPGDLAQLAIDTLGEYGVPDPEKQFKDLANGGRVVFLLDGLDEVYMRNRNSMLSDIRRLITVFPNCRLYITSRPSGYEGELDDIVEDVLTLSPLLISDTHEFVQKQMRDDPAQADRIIEQLMAINRPELIQNPLFLNLAVDIINRYGMLPRSEETLVEEVVRSSLNNWDRARQIESSFPLEQKIRFLESVAATMESRGIHALTREEALDIARSIAGQIGSVSRGDELFDEVLRSGLIVESGAEHVAFLHLIIQEYFLALNAGEEVA